MDAISAAGPGFLIFTVGSFYSNISLAYLRVEHLRLLVESEGLQHDTPCALRVAQLLQLELGCGHPEAFIMDVDLEHAPVDLADGVEPFLEEREFNG